MDTTAILIIIGIAVFASLLIYMLLSSSNHKNSQTIATLKMENEHLEKDFQNATDKNNLLFIELKDKDSLINNLEIKNKVLEDKMQGQKEELESLQKKFSDTFENLANRIFQQKTETFATLNQEKLKPLLEPLTKEIEAFRNKVEDVYVKEAKERFSLGEKVNELMKLNQQISAEANNLATALKNNSKTQGRWGEMILENILEKSGLTKGREYFMEYQLEDEEGKAMKSASDQRKMRPDAIVKYPGNRSIIIDSKVSLNAYSRYVTETDDNLKAAEMKQHLSDIRNHIISLSDRGYDDYRESLDFVMMFIPVESAYIAAIQTDPELWNFAYDRRILLLSPTNLITALKLVVDLWKREFQDINAIKIAAQGGKLYDKFVGFIEAIDNVGNAINKAQTEFQLAQKRLYDGKDNLITQAEKLKELGANAKKSMK